ncbi:MAG: HTH-type transcriptional activator IlvY [Pseudomonadales bacterium]|nr:HTH-type transcriptional activator IlvY [Pseudomonadales bacterium]
MQRWSAAMKFNELQIFLHLCKTLNFARTSAACHVSPSSLSRMIQRLEAELGLPLFERDNRSVRLTAAGLACKRFAEETRDNWLELHRELQAQDHELQGEISLFCSVTASYSFLYELLSRFRDSHPRIEPKIHTGDSAQTLDRIQQDQEDIGIAAIPPQIPATLAVRTLADTPLVFIAPVQGYYFDKKLIRDGDIAWQQVPMILSEKGLARQSAQAWFRRMKIKPNIYAQVAGNEAIVSMVSLGFGIGLVPQLVVDNSPLRHSIRILAVDHDMPPFAVGLCVLKRKLANPLIKAFWDLAAL